MNFITCYETEQEGWVVDLGRDYAGNFDSIDSFLDEIYKHFPVVEGEGLWYARHEDDHPSKRCDRWKIDRHEIYLPQGKTSHNAVIVFYCDPILVIEVSPEKVLAS